MTFSCITFTHPVVPRTCFFLHALLFTHFGESQETDFGYVTLFWPNLKEYVDSLQYTGCPEKIASLENKYRLLKKFWEPKISYIILWEYFVHFERHSSVRLCNFFNNGYLFYNDAVFSGHPVYIFPDFVLSNIKIFEYVCHSVEIHGTRIRFINNITVFLPLLNILEREKIF